MRNDRYQADVPPYALYALLGASLILNVVMVLKIDGGDSASDPVAVLTDAPAQEVGSASPELAQTAPATSNTQARAELSPVAEAQGWQVAHASVEHSLARTISNAVDSDADALSAVYSRLFMWDLDLRRDVQKGDQIWMVWQPVEGEEPVVAAAWYKSAKLGRTLQVYRYQAPGDMAPSYWHPDGSEAPLRLKSGPIEGYDQITSLLKDRPDHRGMDFRAPVGTDVVSPKAGTVTRVNWNHNANGNCIEVRFPDGTNAKFLHLDKLSVRAGQYVQAGQLLAASGNTGHSTAAHLHYELEKGGKTLDPVEYHSTQRREMPAGALEAFAVVVNDMDASLGTAVASR
ncbi:MAG: murein DD-endopeptidase [Cognaticolwellia sp.]|jgi:murein DD-endopeptidase